MKAALFPVVFSLLICAAAPAVAARYDVQELEMLGEAINDAGQIVGAVSTADGSSHASLYSNGATTDLGTFGEHYSRATAINASGQIAGSYGVAAAGAQAFLYSAGSVSRLLTQGGSGRNRAVSITASGKVLIDTEVLFATKPGSHVAIYDNGNVTEIPELGGRQATATDMNDSGQVCGYFRVVASGDHAFLYEQGEVHDLGTLGGNFSAASSINAAGAVVGWSELAYGKSRHAFLYANHQMVDLGTLDGGDTFARAINNSNQIVGRAVSTAKVSTAFVYERGRMIDLNSLLRTQLPGKFRLGDAIAINNSGQILAEGFRVAAGKRERRTYLLTPH
jgi:probable HAF family extracellular repeat protein